MTQTEQVDLEFERIHQLSIAVIDALTEADASGDEALAAVALTLGRCCDPERLAQSVEDQIKFVEDSLDYCAAYFQEGQA